MLGRSLLPGLFGALSLLAAAQRCAAAGPPATLRLATWNLEWLVAPAQFAELAPACVPEGADHHGRRSIPCDVATHLERGAADHAALAAIARSVDADVVALQEVDGEPAARLVFPGHDFCFTGGPAVQNTGFALRKGIPHRCEPDYLPLSLGDQLRRGAQLVLWPGTRRELHLLAVHLKSGCARGPLDAGAKACRRLAEQAPWLARWVHAQSLAGHAFALLGDFNRDLRAESPSGDSGLWRALTDPGSGAPLEDAAAGAPFRNCRRGQRSSGYIDYILLGGALRGRAIAGSFARVTYAPADAWHRKLSDHCPIALSMRVD